MTLFTAVDAAFFCSLLFRIIIVICLINGSRSGGSSDNSNALTLSAPNQDFKMRTMDDAIHRKIGNKKQ